MYGTENDASIRMARDEDTQFQDTSGEEEIGKPLEDTEEDLDEDDDPGYDEDEDEDDDDDDEDDPDGDE